MAGFNHVVLMGKLVREPDLRYASSLPVCTLRLLVPRSYKGKDGERKYDGLFIDVVVWRRMAEICSQFLHKNSEVLVQGRLELNRWKGKDGAFRNDYRIQSERIQFLKRYGNDEGTSEATTAPDADSAAA